MYKAHIISRSYNLYIIVKDIMEKYQKRNMKYC